MSIRTLKLKTENEKLNALRVDKLPIEKKQISKVKELTFEVGMRYGAVLRCSGVSVLGP